MLTALSTVDGNTTDQHVDIASNVLLMISIDSILLAQMKGQIFTLTLFLFSVCLPLSLSFLFKMLSHISVVNLELTSTTK